MSNNPQWSSQFSKQKLALNFHFGEVALMDDICI